MDSFRLASLGELDRGGLAAAPAEIHDVGTTQQLFYSSVLNIVKAHSLVTD